MQLQMKDGIPDKDLFINIVKTEFPEAAQATALEGVEKCFENSNILVQIWMSSLFKLFRIRGMSYS